MNGSTVPRPGQIPRRTFLSYLCEGAAVAPFLPWLASADPLAAEEFHVHPVYRSDAPVQAALSKLEPGHDEFPLEREQVRIGSILNQWSAALRERPMRYAAVAKSLASDFRGTPAKPVQRAPVGTHRLVQIERLQFAEVAALGAEEFLKELSAQWSESEQMLTAEFQVTRVEGAAGQLRTRVLYELVSAGSGFHREQRSGWWDLEWVGGAGGGDYNVRRWQMREEVRSRTEAACFLDISGQTFRDTASYQQQLAQGVDFWRSTLDSASGIDLYGHNGVSVGDFDGDGFDDLYVCQPAGLPNRLYRNRGDGTFEDVTERSGTGLLDNTSCALFVDIDNDGREDLVVVRAGGPLLFLNQGNGTFRLKPNAFTFASPPQGTFVGAAAADYDRDGWLDIYFCLYVFYQGTDQYKFPTPYFDAENGPANFLMRNNRDGTFRDVTTESGLQKNNSRFSFCCAWGDYDQNGWPDLYVANDFGRKNLYRNNGNGTFTDVAAEAGVQDVGAGMSVCWFDANADGAEDLYVADMWTAAGERISGQEAFKKNATAGVQALYRKHAMGNSIFRNKKDGSFSDITEAARAGRGGWSWSSDAFDFNHDGFPDVYVTNGMVSGPIREDLNGFFWRQVVANSPDEARSAPTYEQGWNAVNELIRADYTWSGYERNNFFANHGDGTFSDIAGAVGLDFVEDGRSFALADFDHDGRQEIFLKNRNAPQLRVLKNVIRELPASVTVRLTGTKSNRDAIGAAVSIDSGRMRQTKRLQAGSGFLAQHSKELFFGLGDAQGPVNLSVQWPSGWTQHFENLPANHRVSVVEGSESVQLVAFSKARQPVESPAGQEQTSRSIETWLLVPVPAPDFNLPDAAGQKHKLTSYRSKPVLLHFGAENSAEAQANVRALAEHAARFEGRLQILGMSVDAGAQTGGSFPQLRATDEVAAVYNLIYRYLFERHRDLPLPAAFLIDAQGAIVKVYQGPLDVKGLERDSARLPQTRTERMTKALPFPGVAATYEYARNNLSFGAVFFQRGYFEQAEVFFRNALNDDPDSAEARYGLGSVYLKQNRTAEAQKSFEAAVKLTAGYADTHPNAWNNLGLLAIGDGKADEAIQDFQAALQQNPAHFVALENLGNAYRQQKRWTDARETLQKALALNADDPEANYSLAMVYAQTEEPAKAYEYLQRALQLRPNYPEALNNLGILYLHTDKPEQAVNAFESCIRAAPEFAQAYLNLARLYAMEQMPEKARGLLQQLLDRQPGQAQAQQMLDQLR